MKKIHKHPFLIGKGWKVAWNNFYRIEPDNKFPMTEVAGYFSEHLFMAQNDQFMIDVGFHGTYHLNREGHYSLYLIKGDYYKGELLEKRIFRSQLQTANLLQDLLIQVSKNRFKKVEGLKFTADTFLVGLKEYSSTARIEYAHW